MARLALVTGATGFVGAALVPALLEAGWRVRVLVRDADRLPSDVRDRLDVVEGDASEADDVARCLEGVDVAYYLLHSMEGGQGDFVSRDRELAETFASAASDAGVGRIVYLGGLHPEGADLAPHMASRVEVGRVLLESGVPTAVLQAGIVLGHDSASFQMLRHLSERLPVAIGPKWLNNHIQPLAIEDAVHYLVAAADLPADVNRSLDVGMDETVTYKDMMKRYARVMGLAPRLVGTVPVLTPRLASYWVGFVTPVDSSVARPLVGSLTHDAVKRDEDADALLGAPEGGATGFDEALRRSVRPDDPKRWGRVAAGVGAAVAATAVVGSLFTAPDSRWYRALRKPAWQPPGTVFPIVWTTLYAGIAAASAATIHEHTEAGEPERSTGYARALGVNLVLNAGWSGLFFRAQRPALATVGAAALAASSWDLVRRAAPLGTGRAVTLGAYAAWCTFATVLSGRIARLNG